MNINPLVSIVTVTYNSEKFIKNCVSSVNKQTYNNIEHVLVDGNSKDGTVELFKKNAFRNPTIVSESDKGIYDAMNKGIKLSKGDFIGFLNSDDYFSSSDSIETIVRNLKKYNVDCVHGNVVFLSKKNKINRVWKSKDFLGGAFSKSWTPAHPTFYCKSSIYKKFGHYNTRYKIAADVELMLRFLEKNKISSKYISQSLVCMREGGVSTNSFQSTLTISKEVRRAHIENDLKFNWFNYFFGKFRKVITQKLLK